MLRVEARGSHRGMALASIGRKPQAQPHLRRALQTRRLRALWCSAGAATLTPEQQRAEEYNRTMQKCVQANTTLRVFLVFFQEFKGVARCATSLYWRLLPVCACAAEACGLRLSRRMSNPFKYHPELGLYYHEVAPGLLCGTQLRTPADVERLAGAPQFTAFMVL